MGGWGLGLGWVGANSESEGGGRKAFQKVFRKGDLTSDLLPHQALCELPESFEAYRKQQHRWHSGPMQLFKLALPDIISAKVGLCLS